MPAPWAAGAQVRIKGRIHGQVTNNVMHFATNTVVNDGPLFDAFLLALANAVAQCVIDTLLPAVSQDWTFEGVDARRIYPSATDPIDATEDVGGIGALGPASVSFASSLLQVRTGGGGRRGRGRAFLPPAGEAQTANSAIDGPTLALLAQFAACVAGKFIGAGATEQWRIGVYSKTNDNEAAGTFDNSFREAISLQPSTSVACMRSRKVGHGS